MKNLFQRRRPAPVTLGGAVMAARMVGVVPPGCVGVAVDAAGRTRRFAEGARMALVAGGHAWCFHPGPYQLVLTPFLAAPEIGLQLRVVVDSPDPLAAQQRFDLFLAGEGGQSVALDAFRAALDAALQRELAQGHLDLPPCTLLEEWNAFRAGLNELLYMRFGVTVDECIPVDLAGQVDYAALLAARALADVPVCAFVTAPLPEPAACLTDAAALRRLFLELPVVTSRLRLLDVDGFARQRALVQRFDHASLAVLTMPALALAAPARPLPLGAQQRRARHTLCATDALDETWAWLARAGSRANADLLDDAERIAANLEAALAGRRAMESA
ncbi:hypothetical protein [Massilia sp. S19_KUP03_FR1]|uniref:hypothetical protein n=1 Tax=Massilia sp. S19_KUP03_FR1 TaxID=3025503 RepID=UPI002FCDD983